MISNLRLTKELIDQVVFGMENQDKRYVVDTDEAEVIEEVQIDTHEPGRYLDIPEWRSVDGYNLMERFVASLHNPIFRERLRAILASGRGVFRQFKDALRERPEIERRWFTFKERAMRELVSEWYNDRREREGLERLAVEGADTETDNLIASDFVFRWATPDLFDRIIEIDHQGFLDAHRDLKDGIAENYYQRSRSNLPPADHPASQILLGETQGGDWVSFVWSIVGQSAQLSAASVISLYVDPEFRGLGLGRELLFEYCRRAHESGITDVTLDLQGSLTELEAKLQEYGFTSVATVVRLDLDRWHRADLL